MLIENGKTPPYSTNRNREQQHSDQEEVKSQLMNRGRTQKAHQDYPLQDNQPFQQSKTLLPTSTPRQQLSNDRQKTIQRNPSHPQLAHTSSASNLPISHNSSRNPSDLLRNKSNYTLSHNSLLQNSQRLLRRDPSPLSHNKSFRSINLSAMTSSPRLDYQLNTHNNVVQPEINNTLSKSKTKNIEDNKNHSKVNSNGVKDNFTRDKGVETDTIVRRRLRELSKVTQTDDLQRHLTQRDDQHFNNPQNNLQNRSQVPKQEQGINTEPGLYQDSDDEQFLEDQIQDSSTLTNPKPDNLKGQNRYNPPNLSSQELKAQNPNSNNKVGNNEQVGNKAAAQGLEKFEMIFLPWAGCYGKISYSLQMNTTGETSQNANYDWMNSGLYKSLYGSFYKHKDQILSKHYQGFQDDAASSQANDRSRKSSFLSSKQEPLQKQKTVTKQEQNEARVRQVYQTLELEIVDGKTRTRTEFGKQKTLEKQQTQDKAKKRQSTEKEQDKEILKEDAQNFNPENLDIYKEMEVIYMQSLLRKKAQTLNNQSSLAEIHEKSKTTLAVLTNNLIQGDLLLDQIFQLYQDPIRANNIKLLLRCKKMYDARVDAKKILMLLIIYQVRQYFNYYLQDVYTQIEKLKTKSPLDKQDKLLLRKALYTLTKLQSELNVFKHEHKIFKSKFIFNNRDYLVDLPSMIEELQAVLEGKSLEASVELNLKASKEDMKKQISRLSKDLNTSVNKSKVQDKEEKKDDYEDIILDNSSIMLQQSHENQELKNILDKIDFNNSQEFEDNHLKICQESLGTEGSGQATLVVSHVSGKAIQEVNRHTNQMMLEQNHQSTAYMETMPNQEDEVKIEENRFRQQKTLQIPQTRVTKQPKSLSGYSNISGETTQTVPTKVMESKINHEQRRKTNDPISIKLTLQEQYGRGKQNQEFLQHQ